MYTNYASFLKRLGVYFIDGRNFDDSYLYSYDIIWRPDDQLRYE